jgi:probable phosphoglycerate mutase
MSPTTVLLIRHGETDWNAEGRWQGFALTDLNALGRAQAAALAAHLRLRPIHAVYSSDLPRAVQTAQPLAQALAVPLRTDPQWREIHLGSFQGLTHEEMAARYPDELAKRRQDVWDYAYPGGGESRRDLQERAYRAWQSLLADASGEEVAVVSHGGTIRMLLWKLFGEDDPRLHDPLPNTSVTILKQAAEGWKLHRLAETVHLDNEL